MNAVLFTDKNGETVWNRNGVVSMAIDSTKETFDLNTGFVNSERHIMWIKGNDEEVVERQVNALITSINSGKLATIRVFSKTPFYTKSDGSPQDQDINPTTGETLGRYSQVRLCPAHKVAELHRQFVEVEVEATPEDVEMNA